MLQGYARVSSADDDLSAQEAALRAAGCTEILVEDGRGTVGDQRARLAALLDGLDEGDTLVVTRMDRIARSIADLRDLVETLTAKGVALKTTAQPIDTAASTGPTFRDLLGAFAEFEANLRRERQRDGIAKAKAEGVYKGRKRSVERDKVQELLASGVGPTEIAAQLGISRTSVYRATTVPLLPGPKASRKVQ